MQRSEADKEDEVHKGDVEFDTQETLPKAIHIQDEEE